MDWCGHKRSARTYWFRDNITTDAQKLEQWHAICVTNNWVLRGSTKTTFRHCPFVVVNRRKSKRSFIWGHTEEANGNWNKFQKMQVSVSLPGRRCQGIVDLLGGRGPHRTGWKCCSSSVAATWHNHRVGEWFFNWRLINRCASCNFAGRLSQKILGTMSNSIRVNISLSLECYCSRVHK